MRQPWPGTDSKLLTAARREHYNDMIHQGGGHEAVVIPTRVIDSWV